MTSLLISALAATRLVRAYRFEQIGEPIRDAIDEWTSQPVKNSKGQLNVKATKRREWIRDLAECPHCSGFWITLGVVLVSRVPAARPVVRALAAATILSAFVDHYPNFAFDADE